MSKDPYEVLGVDGTASPDEIKKAYRRLAKKLHPDRNPGDRASEDRFKDVSRAYEILSDPKTRSLYDRFGHDGLHEGFEDAHQRARRGGRQPGGTAAGWPFGATGDDGGGFHFGDLFDDLFGRRETARGAPPEGGADVHGEIDLGFAEALVGGEHALRLRAEGPCPACDGEGVDSAAAAPCPDCGGTGRRQGASGALRVRQKCPRCRGTGRTAGRPCGTCGGTRTQPLERRLKVRIPPGARDGDTLRLRGQGAPGRRGGPPGDLRVTIHVPPPPGVTVSDDEIHLTFPVTVPEAFEGAKLPLRTPWGSIQVTIPPRSGPHTRLRIPDHGLPRRKGKGRGALILEVVVEPPDSTDPEIAKSVSALHNGYTTDPREKIKRLFDR